MVISSQCVSDAQRASQQFREVRNGIGEVKALTHAQHIIQSFKPDEVTSEQALLIGQELCTRLLQDNYQYVLATHVDHDHIHNHIIFNNMNMFTGRTFETEHNQGKIKERAWAKVRKLSDEICQEQGLSVIETPEKGLGTSHYEWGNAKFPTVMESYTPA